jgi:LmbE family N-acetylglucosaminyl deacetylase
MKNENLIDRQEIDMAHPLKLMEIFAHPDDESLGTGGTLAKYAAEGVATYLVTATRGERGWWGSEADYPGPEALGRTREAELHSAAQVLGLSEVVILDYLDGELDQAPAQEVIAKLTAHIRRIRPDVVVTFDPDGVYGHPDHIAISQLTTAAMIAAADSTYADSGQPPHRVSKLYYRIFTLDDLTAYQVALGDLVIHIDGVERRAAGWPAWAITTRIENGEYWPQVWRAVSCHRSQLPGYQALKNLPAEHHRQLWGQQTFYRAFSLVNGGRAVESDLFAGLR